MMVFSVFGALDGVAEINVFNVRDNFFGRAEEIVAKLNERTSCKVTLHDFSDPEVLRASIADSAILVNGTSGLASSLFCLTQQAGFLRIVDHIENEEVFVEHRCVGDDGVLGFWSPRRRS